MQREITETKEEEKNVNGWKRRMVVFEARGRKPTDRETFLRWYVHLRSRISRIRCRIFLSLFLRFFNRRSCGSDFNNSRHAVSDTAAKEILLGNLLSVHGNGCVSIYFIYCPLLSLFPLIPRHRLIYVLALWIFLWHSSTSASNRVVTSILVHLSVHHRITSPD